MKVVRIVLPWAFWIPLCFATYMAWTPMVPLDSSLPNDKVTHLMAFGYLTGAFAVAYTPWATWPRTAGIMLAYAGLIEVVQAFIPNRSCSLYDLLVDAFGIGLALSGLYALNRMARLLKQVVHMF